MTLTDAFDWLYGAEELANTIESHGTPEPEPDEDEDEA